MISAHRVGPDATDYLLLLMLGATWGASFFLIKLAVATLPPLTAAAGRIAIGAVVLLLLLWGRGGSLPRGAVLGELAVLGATLCYAGNGIVARRLPGLSSSTVAAAMLLTAALAGVPASLVLDQPWRLEPSPLSILARGALTLVFLGLAAPHLLPWLRRTRASP